MGDAVRRPSRPRLNWVSRMALRRMTPQFLAVMSISLQMASMSCFFDQTVVAALWLGKLEQGLMQRCNVNFKEHGRALRQGS